MLLDSACESDSKAIRNLRRDVGAAVYDGLRKVLKEKGITVKDIFALEAIITNEIALEFAHARLQLRCTNSP